MFWLFLGAWMYGRAGGGRILLDCGPHPTRKLFLFNAVLFLVLGITGGFAGNSVSKAFGIAGPAFGVSFGVYWLIIATGRLQVRENGIWAYWGLLRWKKIASYRWADDGTLMMKTRGGLSFLRRGALPVPSEHTQAFDDLLAKHCPAKATDETD